MRIDYKIINHTNNLDVLHRDDMSCMENVSILWNPKTQFQGMFSISLENLIKQCEIFRQKARSFAKWENLPRKIKPPKISDRRGPPRKHSIEVIPSPETILGRRQVLCVETGEVYSSERRAYLDNNLGKKALHNAIIHGSKINDMTFVYVA